MAQGPPRFGNLRFTLWLGTAVSASMLAGSVTLARVPEARLVASSGSGALPTGNSQDQGAASRARAQDILDSIREDLADPTPAPTPPPPPDPQPQQPAPSLQPATPAPPPPPPVYRDYLLSADGTLHTGVGIYNDCTGRTELTHSAAAIDTCIGGRTYFVGHNPGVFTPLTHMGVGSVITWYDDRAVAHRLVVIETRRWESRNGVPPPARAGEAAQFQTCLVNDGSVDLILDAVAG